MYQIGNFEFLPFPLKVDTNDKQLALVKWNNVFLFLIYTIHTKIKNKNCSNDSILSSDFLVSISFCTEVVAI